MTNTDTPCRSCDAVALSSVLDLGQQPLANNLPRPEDRDLPEPMFPLCLTVCTNCWLAQISDLVPPVDLYTEYLYFSSFSDTMLGHARTAADRHASEFSLGPESLVVEIASNDGYLLQNFQEAKIPCLGIEPAQNIAKVAREKGIETLTEFFGKSLAEELAQANRSADLVLGNNVFAHAPDTNDFVAGLERLLKPEGVIALEFPYAVDLVTGCEFDTIYHEHVFYFSLTALMPLFQRHGLEIFRVERLSIHGGSLRLFAARAGARKIDDSVAQFLREEKAGGFDTLRPYQAMGQRVQEIREELRRLVQELKAAGKTIAAYGASAKGSTLLNYCGLGTAKLDFIADRSDAKVGRLSPGQHVPIVPMTELLERRPDYTLLLTWNFAEEILAQQQAYRDAGGRFIIPIPRPKIL
jgi:SAM-dependent methyltransferase